MKITTLKAAIEILEKAKDKKMPLLEYHEVLLKAGILGVGIEPEDIIKSLYRAEIIDFFNKDYITFIALKPQSLSLCGLQNTSSGAAQQILESEKIKLSLSDELNNIAKDAKDACDIKNWSRTWLHSGCYLHLEVSEFIESLRGKGESTPAEEAADVLFVLLSTMIANGVDVGVTIDNLKNKIKYIKENKIGVKTEDK